MYTSISDNSDDDLVPQDCFDFYNTIEAQPVQVDKVLHIYGLDEDFNKIAIDLQVNFGEMISL